MADIDNNIEALAKYLVAVIKCNDDAEESIKLISAKLKELLNIELDTCLEIVQEKEKAWGETAVRVNAITREITKQIAARKIS